MASKKNSKPTKEEVTLTDQLCEKFKFNDIEFVVVNAYDYESRNGHVIKAFVLPYIKKESGEQRLDEVLGAENWENDFTFPDEHGRIKYKIKWRKPDSDEWLFKQEGASLDTRERGQFSNTAFESALAFAEKRCLAKLGIGRYLKLCPEIEVTVSRDWQPGWNKYAFRSKTIKDQNNNGKYLSFYYQDPMLPKDYLHEDEKHLADEVNDGNKPTPQQWDQIEKYYKAFDLEERDKWNEYLYQEEVDNETGAVSYKRRNISQDRAVQILASMRKGYGKLIDGVPENYSKSLPETNEKK